MKKLVCLLSILFLSACGSGGGAGGGSGGAPALAPTPVAPIVYQYTFAVVGAGGKYGGMLQSNFYDADHQEQNLGVVIVPMTGTDFTIFGRDMYLTFINSGTVPLTLKVMKADTIDPLNMVYVQIQFISVAAGQTVTVTDNL